MNYKTIKLNDLFFMIDSLLLDYYYTGNKTNLSKAVISYYWYKKRNGKKVIERLENELVKNELEYI